ncbi:YtxH domain-containing protein [Hymenobacter algoricola]|uniref:YtxH domain-containing protein n=1 Tax=Hymenobacter algoricola TaxID=486267 RepID=A0ABP7N6F3_9BACT
MNDTNGKVILSLLAGATAGIVAGLLLAPETGDQTRAGLKKSATKWGGDLSKLLKDGLGKFGEMQGAASADPAGRSAADDLLSAMNKEASGSTASVDRDDYDSDYDGVGGDARHSARYGRSL